MRGCARKALIAFLLFAASATAASTLAGQVIAQKSSPVVFLATLPTYDRVNGITARAGGALRFPSPGIFQPELRVKGSYRTVNNRLGGGAELALTRPTTLLAAGVEREVLTNETWIRGDNANTTSFLFGGKDYRNYYLADRIYAEVAQDFNASKSLLLGFTVRAQRERASSLAAHDPWVVLSRQFRENPSVDAGDISSLSLLAHAGWSGITSALQVESLAELAAKTAGGDFSFNRYVFAVEYATQTIANHALDISFHAQGPLPGTDALPLQRWSFTGGSPILYTFPLGIFRGDRVVAVKTEYLIPGNQRLRLPRIGAPDLTLIHTVGMAWTQNSHRRLEQNVGAQVQLLVVYGRVIVNPTAENTDGDNVKLSVGVKLPGSHHPWEKLAEKGRRPRVRSRL